MMKPLRTIYNCWQQTNLMRRLLDDAKAAAEAGAPMDRAVLIDALATHINHIHRMTDRYRPAWEDDY
jgi:hypothetical protein